MFLFQAVVRAQSLVKRCLQGLKGECGLGTASLPLEVLGSRELDIGSVQVSPAHPPNHGLSGATLWLFVSWQEQDGVGGPGPLCRKHPHNPSGLGVSPAAQGDLEQTGSVEWVLDTGSLSITVLRWVRGSTWWASRVLHPYCYKWPWTLGIY